MILKLAVETIVLCAAFIALVFAFVAKDRKGGLHWYPKTVQKEAIRRGVASEQYIGKQNKRTQWIGLLMIAFIVLGSVFGINKVRDWWSAAWQIYLMLFALNLFDAVVIDWVWVRKTKFWVIPALSDLEIGKPLNYLIKERVIAAIVYIPLAALVGCIAFVL